VRVVEKTAQVSAFSERGLDECHSKKADRASIFPLLVAEGAGISGKRLSALAHPIRLHILSVAESEDISASEVAVALSEPLGVVAYHFRVLHTAGLIELVGTERRRGSIQSFYRATTTGWSDLAETVEQLISD
jgi:DNA-binding transcriptional ArsR family regulator